MKQINRLLAAMLIMVVFLVGCGSNNASPSQSNSNNENTKQELSKEDLPQVEGKTGNSQNATTEKAASPMDEVVGKEEPQKPTDPKEAVVINKQEAVTNLKHDTPKQANETADKPQEKEQTKQVATNNPSNMPTTSQKVEQESKPNTPITEVTIAIRADAETGVILKATKVSINEGDTVLDVLKKVTKQNRIQMEYRGTGATAYIEGIQNLYEFDKGPKSGWMYSVNGTFMKKGAGTTEVKPGDKIEWAYTLDLGKDLGATVNE
ncbi:MAG TPA: DUF4430 domain-containing protein [Bacillales bacterium]|nr:DUF4430 domain-containing protein [Bacillales bacterium]